MRPYRFVTPAYRDLREILDYFNEFSNLAAGRFLVKLDARLRLLAKFPHSGQSRPDFNHPHLRYIVLDDYLIAYDPATKPLTIVAIRHGSQKTAKSLEDLP